MKRVLLTLGLAFAAVAPALGNRAVNQNTGITPVDPGTTELRFACSFAASDGTATGYAGGGIALTALNGFSTATKSGSGKSMTFANPGPGISGGPVATGPWRWGSSAAGGLATVVLRVRWTTNDPNNGALYVSKDGYASDTFLVGTSGGKLYCLVIGDTGAGSPYSIFLGSTPLVKDVWYDIVVTADNTTAFGAATIYLDGVAETVTRTTTRDSHTGNFDGATVPEYLGWYDPLDEHLLNGFRTYSLIFSAGNAVWAKNLANL